MLCVAGPGRGVEVGWDRDERAETESKAVGREGGEDEEEVTTSNEIMCM